MVIPGTGFLLNNEMDDFSVKAGVPNAFGLVGDDANAIAPGKRPLSSMTPTIVVGDDQIAVLGTPGGSRIISMVIQGVLALDAGASALEAAAEPRVHHQYLPDEVSIEKEALSPELRAGLEARGHVIKEEPRTWGNMQVVTWDLTDGDVEAGADPRWKSVGKGSTQDGGIFR
jgi:gamma-glutamyltranspeptidase/glutathione hydrolase